MLKVIFIPGTNYLDYYRYSSYNFALAHLLRKDNKYFTWFINNKQRETILDNGAAEIGKSIDVSEYIKIMRAINPLFCWCPDVLYNMKDTLKLTKDFILKLNKNDLEYTQLVGLPQGGTLDEWLYCYKEMIKMPEIKVIALSKYSINCFKELVGSNELSIVRPFAIEYLLNHNLISNKHTYHCAGANNKIIEEIKQLKKYRFISSIDSNIAFKLSVHRIKIDECKVEPIERLNHNIKNLDTEQLSMIRYNINKIKECLK